MLSLEELSVELICMFEPHLRLKHVLKNKTCLSLHRIWRNFTANKIPASRHSGIGGILRLVAFHHKTRSPMHRLGIESPSSNAHGQLLDLKINSRLACPLRSVSIRTAILRRVVQAQVLNREHWKSAAMRRSRAVAFVPATPPGHIQFSGRPRHSSWQWPRCSRDGPSRVSADGREASPILRSVLIALAAALGAAAVGGTDAAIAYGLVSGRLDKCRGDIPCVSTTSVGNPSKFGPPWSYMPQTGDADAAWGALKGAVEKNRDNGRIVEAMDGPEEYYLRAEFPSSFKGTDDVEFRLLKDDALVTYRSASREAIYVYPLQTPINTEKNKTRLADIRQALGWEEFDGSNVYSGSGE